MPRVLAEHLGCSPALFKHDWSARLEARRKPPLLAGFHSAPKGYSAVPEIDVRAAAGTGAWNDDLEEIKEAWLFAEPLIHHGFRAKSDDLRMIAVDGVSMEPLPSSDDRILIDVSRKAPVSPGIFVIWDGMGLVAKRARTALQAPHGRAKVSQPRIRQLRALGRGDLHRRTGGLGLQEAVGGVRPICTSPSTAGRVSTKG